MAERQATFGVERRLGTVTLREASRYQSQVYRDLANSIVVPAFAVHDLYADWHPTSLAAFSGGLAVINATNVRKLRVRSPATPENDGATSYSDMAGYPLPGRQWRLCFEWDF